MGDLQVQVRLNSAGWVVLLHVSTSSRRGNASEQLRPWYEILCFGQGNKKASILSRVLPFLLSLDTYTNNGHGFEEHVWIAALS